MPGVHIDHVSMCVNDLEVAIDDWRDILNVLTPEIAAHLTRGQGDADGTPMVWATFQNPDPLGVSIQLWAPGAPDTWVHKVLAKRGEALFKLGRLEEAERLLRREAGTVVSADVRAREVETREAGSGAR